MSVSIVTSEDLLNFKVDLLSEIKKLLDNKGVAKQKKWLKSTEVRELLNISPGTLQNMRIKGILPYTKMGGVFYYDNDDILKNLNNNRVHNKL